MLGSEEIVKSYRLAKYGEYTEGCRIAYQVIEHELPQGIKQIVKEAFPGPQSLGYQNPIDLLEVVRYIIADAVQIEKKGVDFFNIVPTNSFDAIHHDHSGYITSIITSIIKNQVPKFNWQTSIDYFDGLIFANGKGYAYVEAGWILPHQVRALIYAKDIKQLWLFPYKRRYDSLAPYYFVVKKGSGWQKVIDEDRQWIRKELEKVDG